MYCNIKHVFVLGVNVCNLPFQPFLHLSHKHKRSLLFVDQTQIYYKALALRASVTWSALSQFQLKQFALLLRNMSMEALSGHMEPCWSEWTHASRVSINERNKSIRSSGSAVLLLRTTGTYWVHVLNTCVCIRKGSRVQTGQVIL